MVAGAEAADREVDTGCGRGRGQRLQVGWWCWTVAKKWSRP